MVKDLLRLLGFEEIEHSIEYMLLPLQYKGIQWITGRLYKSSQLI